MKTTIIGNLTHVGEIQAQPKSLKYFQSLFLIKTLQLCKQLRCLANVLLRAVG